MINEYISQNDNNNKIQKESLKLTKEFIISTSKKKNDNINERNDNDLLIYNNFTDILIEKLFDKSTTMINDEKLNLDKRDDKNKIINLIDIPNFFSNIEVEIKKGQNELDNQISALIKEDEENTKIINDKKEVLMEKLEKIKNYNTNFESKINEINEVYIDRLSYITILSKNLNDFDKFKNNIKFAKNVIYYINELNKDDDISKIKVPLLFSDTDKLLSEGIEVYIAFKHLLSSCSSSSINYNNFIHNFNQLENKIKDNIKYSISHNYIENNWEKLQFILKVTETISSEMIIELYNNYIIENIMKLNDYIQNITKLDFKNLNEDNNENEENNELLNLIFKISDDFHQKIIDISNDQFGTEYSKIYILFPENSQKIVINNLVTNTLKKINIFRQIFANESDKSDNIYLKLVQYFYPKTIQFLKDYKLLLDYSKTDLYTSVEQENNIFLRTIEATYMSKEKNILNNFIDSSLKNKISELKNAKNEYLNIQKNKKSKELQKDNLSKLINDLFDIINSTNFSILHKQSTMTIGRYNILIQSKDEKEDLIETFCKEVFDSIQTLLSEYCLICKFIIQESQKLSFHLIDKHLLFLSKINFFNIQFKQIFLFELRDFFRSFKFYDIIEEYVYNSTSKIDINIDNLFSDLNSFISIELSNLLKLIKNKETYKINSDFNEQNTSEINNIAKFVKFVLDTIKTSWNGMDKYIKLFHLLFTNMINDKMIDIYKNGKFSEIGVIIMKNDFKKIATLFAEDTDEYFYNKIYDVFFLSEILTTPKEELKDFCENLSQEGKYDKDLIKIIEKKRKGI